MDTASYVAAESTEAGPLNDLVVRERIAEVRAVLATMKLEKAQLLLLRQSGLSYREIAAALRINAASVGTMLVRAETEFATLYRKHQLQRHQGQDRNTHRLNIAKEER